MKASPPILAVVDPSLRHRPALHAARTLALRSGAPLHLCLFDHDPLVERSADLVDPAVMRLARAQYERERHAWLATETRTLAEDGVEAHHDFVWTPEPAEGLLAKCLELGPAVVVRDAGSPEDDCAAGLRMLRYCPAPLLLVRPRPEPAPPGPVLACIDVARPGEDQARLNRLVLQGAGLLAFAGDLELHVAHVLPFLRAASQDSPSRRRLHDLVRDEDDRAFLAFAGQNRVREDRCHRGAGRPDRELARIARECAASALVLGCSGHGGMRRFELGSTVTRLLAAPPCDLLLVKPAGFLQDLERSLDLDGLRQRYGVPGAAGIGLIAA